MASNPQVFVLEGAHMVASSEPAASLLRLLPGAVRTRVNFSAGYTPDATELVVDNADAAGLAPGITVLIGTERLLVTALNATSNRLTVIRGVDGTTPAPILDNAEIRGVREVQLGELSYSRGFPLTAVNNSAGYGAGATRIQVDNASFPGVPSNGLIMIGDEILNVTSKSGNNLNVQRGRHGTSAVPIANNDVVRTVRITGSRLGFHVGDLEETVPLIESRRMEVALFCGDFNPYALRARLHGRGRYAAPA